MEPTIGQSMPSVPASPVAPAAGDQGMAVPAQPAAMAAPGTPIQTAERGHFFKDIDWTQVFMTGIVIFTLGMSIYASRQQILFVRQGKKSVTQDIDEIKSNLQTVMGDQYQPYTT